jgi:hypothetical protein
MIEARIKFPAVPGTRGGLRLFPEPQDQPADAPRCEWKDECGKYGKVIRTNTALLLLITCHKQFAAAELRQLMLSSGQTLWSCLAQQRISRGMAASLGQRNKPNTLMAAFCCASYG